MNVAMSIKLRDGLDVLTYIRKTLLRNFTEAELLNLVNEGENSILWGSNVFTLPNHTQVVERCVKMVTEASQHVSDETERDGYIRSKISSRKLMPAFKTKKQYAPHM